MCMWYILRDYKVLNWVSWLRRPGTRSSISTTVVMTQTWPLAGEDKDPVRGTRSQISVYSGGIKTAHDCIATAVSLPTVVIAQF